VSTPYLPFDVARCAGVHDTEDGVTYWREGCERCLRRIVPGHPIRQVTMEPPAIIVFECESLIEERPTP
jgi:hypothetical protein